MSSNIKRVLLISLFVILSVAACGPAATSAPAATATPKTPQCSVVVPALNSGMGMMQILAKLGQDYTTDDPVILVNGSRESKHYLPHPNDFIVLEQKPDNCVGEYRAAREVHFPHLGKGTFVDMNGFQVGVTEKSLMEAAKAVCDGVRAGFNDDIYTGGCYYATAVMISRNDGTYSCTTYSSVIEAYSETLASGVSDIGWAEIHSEGIIIETGQTPAEMCPPR